MKQSAQSEPLTGREWALHWWVCCFGKSKCRVEFALKKLPAAKWEARQLAHSQQARFERCDHALHSSNSMEGDYVFMYTCMCMFI